MRLPRRDFLRLSAAGAGLTILPFGLRGKSPERPLNLLFLWTDQQRPDTLGFLGNRFARTPNLDGLARQSAVLTNTRVVHPVCTPSRGALLSGRWPHQTGVTANNLPMPLDVPLLPELLKHRDDNATGYMGKWHLGDEVFAQHGFQEWVSIEDNYERYFSPARDRSARSSYHHYLVSKGYKPDPANGTFRRTTACAMPTEHTKPEFLARAAEAFLQRHRNQPFVLSVNFLEPHSPYLSVLRQDYDPANCPIPETFGRDLGADQPLRYRARQQADRSQLNSPAALQEINAHYWGLVEQVDRGIGRILRALEATGQSDQTVVVFTSDHGDQMGSHGMLGKSVMYEGAVQVPWMVRAPGLRAHRTPRPVSHIDFLPTVLDLLGEGSHRDLPGRSLRTVLAGENTPPEPVFIAWSPNPKDRDDAGDAPAAVAGSTEQQLETVRNESTRTVVSPDGLKLSLRDCDLPTLFDLNRDPLETVNLVGRTDYREPQRALTRKIRQWQEKTGDRLALSQD